MTWKLSHIHNSIIRYWMRHHFLIKDSYICWNIEFLSLIIYVTDEEQLWIRTVVIQDVRGFFWVMFPIYTEFRCPQKSYSYALLTEGWWLYVSIKYTQTCRSSGKKKFISSLQKVCVHGGENSIPWSLFDPVSSHLILSHLQCMSPMVSTGGNLHSILIRDRRKHWEFEGCI